MRDVKQHIVKLYVAFSPVVNFKWHFFHVAFSQCGILSAHRISQMNVLHGKMEFCIVKIFLDLDKNIIIEIFLRPGGPGAEPPRC